MKKTNSYKTLIEEYHINNHNSTKTRPIYQLIKEDEDIITYDNNNSCDSISLSFFGRAKYSTGRLFCPNIDYLRNDIHNFTRQALSRQGHLSGSMVIQRNCLKIQHLCLDFDLKTTIPSSSFFFIPSPSGKLCLEDFCLYKKKKEKNFFTPEYNFIYNEKSKKKKQRGTNDDDDDDDDDDDEEKETLNINFIIYEIILLLRYLGIRDDNIFILGKAGGCFEKGFHIEVPSFLMNYQDIALFYEIMHSFIKNDDFFDATLNYSAFGSTKSNEGAEVYLPYCCFSKENDNIICEKPMFEDLKEAFDYFNIFKPLRKEEKNIHYFDIIFFKKDIFSNTEKILKLIKENEQGLKTKQRNFDMTIPYEYQERHLFDNKNNETNDAEIIQNTIKSDIMEKKKNDKKKKMKKNGNDDDDDDDDDDILSFFCKKHKKNALRTIHIGDLFIAGKREYKIFKFFLPKLIRRVKKYGDVQEMYQLHATAKTKKMTITTTSTNPTTAVDNNNAASNNFFCYACQPDREIYSNLDSQPQSYRVKIISNVLKKYSNTMDASFIFGKTSSNNNDDDDNNTILIEREIMNRQAHDQYQFDDDNNNNDRGEKKRKNIIFHSNDNMFCDKHIIRLYSLKDFKYTIHFLIAGYFSCYVDASSALVMKMLVDWLWFLGQIYDSDDDDDYNNNKNEDENIISDFLQIYNYVRSNSLSINFSVEWIRLCLKHLIVAKNVICFEEALSIIRKVEGKVNLDKVFLSEDLVILRNFAKKQIFTIRGATHDVIIPDIISAAILLCTNESIIYELLAIYVPIVLTGANDGNSNNNNNGGRFRKNNCDSNANNNLERMKSKPTTSSSSSSFTSSRNRSSFIESKTVTWDGTKWKRYHCTSNTTISFHLPEIYYAANIQNQVSIFRRELRKENAKKKERNNDCNIDEEKNDGKIRKDKKNDDCNDDDNDFYNNNNKKNINSYIRNIIEKQWYNNDNNNNNSINGNDDDDDDSNLIPDRLHCISVNNTTLNQILHKIQAFWAKTEIFPIPSIFITILLPDKYVLAGISVQNTNKLIVIKPIPMYFQEQVEADSGGVFNDIDDNDDGQDDDANNNGDVNDLDSLLNHVGYCSFLNNQFFPIVRKILKRAQRKKKRKEEKRRGKKYIKKKKSSIIVHDQQSQPSSSSSSSSSSLLTPPQYEQYSACLFQFNNDNNEDIGDDSNNNNDNNDNGDVSDMVLFEGSYFSGLGGNILFTPNTNNNNNNNNKNNNGNVDNYHLLNKMRESMKKKKKKIETKRNLHLYLTEEQCKHKEVRALIKLTKYFILKQIANSYGDMMDVYRLLLPERKDQREKFSRMIEQYLKSSSNREERKKNLDDRIRVLADCYELIASDHANRNSFPPDIPAQEMTLVECDCPLTRVCMSLLQTFSYDVELLLYFFRLILRATCSNSNDFVNKIIHIFLGDTNSGKTTVLQLFLSVVGNQAGILSPHTVNHSSTIDRYHDLSKSYSFAKFWYMDEIANKPFNRQLINQITGNSRLFIRANYDSGNNVKLASTILIFGNNKPTFTEQCSALINRLRYISFRSRFESNTLVNFKMCMFPKLKIYERYQRQLELGMKALFLHAVCHASYRSSSPFYLYDHLFLGELETTQNIRISTEMYSPIIDIVENILLICDIVEDSTHGITQKRLTHLLNSFDIVTRLNISSISDAITFISKRYPLIVIDDTSLLTKCDVAFRDESVFYGIKEINVSVNDDRITYSKRKKMDEYNENGSSKRQKKKHF